ncbi:hypothetical protein KY285_004792 [Solanum tuberosum]|nr:hypothetical protein KY289_005215 [Solanum tuberosum]KAH0751644.1 hypothetical protein KY285_004792 [Solanum tuberosum]
MKIFNWVHRKFHQKDGRKDIDELKISNEIIGHHDTQILLQDASFAHMLDIWNGGILTIGTFGFDPLMKNVQDQQSVIDIESLEEEEELEEEEYYSVENEIQEYEIPFNDHEGINEELYPLIYANIGDEMIYNEDIIESNNNSSTDQTNTKMMKKERITLADLFSADSDHHHRKADRRSANKITESDIFTKKSNSSPQVKNGLSFAKKLIPRVKDEPIQKLQKGSQRLH